MSTFLSRTRRSSLLGRSHLASRSHSARVLVFAVSLLFAATTAFGQAPASGHWEGEIDLGQMQLQILVDLAETAGAWTGTIDIPEQNAKGLALESVVVEGDQVRFAIGGVPGEPRFDGRLTDGRIEGQFFQGPVEASFTLGRDKVERAKKPQEPTRPFPYVEEEVTYKSGDIQLAGTLTLPDAEGPHPAAVLITGSGPQDRDESLLGHKPFLVLSDALTRAGVAVLRVDDRGVGGSTGSVSQSTTSDFADDVLAGVEFLRGHAAIAADRIGLIGHSEGAIVGPLAAMRAPDKIAYTVLLAGTAVTGADVLRLQMQLIARANGATDEGIQESRALQERAIQLLGSDRPRDEVAPEMRVVIQEQLALNPGTASLSGEDLDAAVEQTLSSNLTPWFRYFVKYDPSEALRVLKAPTLVLNGSLDLQVDADQNLWRIGEALGEAQNPDFTIRYLEGLNHLFQNAETGSPAEYSTIEETFAPDVLEMVSSWIVERFG